MRDSELARLGAVATRSGASASERGVQLEAAQEARSLAAVSARGSADQQTLADALVRLRTIGTRTEEVGNA